jgi:hypothetical protein
MTKPYTINNEDDNVSISVFKDDLEIMRMIRKEIWHLYPVIENKVDESNLITKDRYRYDLIERIQLGKYNKYLTVKSHKINKSDFNQELTDIVMDTTDTNILIYF